MSQPGDEREADGSQAERPPPPPDLGESLSELGATARASLGAATASAKAMRSLVAADLSLARSALGRAVAFAGVAIVFGASAWLFLMGSLVALLTSLGLSWLLAMLIAALLSLAVTAYACWRAMHYFDHTRLQATRRQLARLGIGELADFMPGPGSSESARDAARRHAQARQDPEKKTEPGVDAAPP